MKVYLDELNQLAEEIIRCAPLLGKSFESFCKDYNAVSDKYVQTDKYCTDVEQQLDRQIADVEQELERLNEIKNDADSETAEKIQEEINRLDKIKEELDCKKYDIVEKHQQLKNCEKIFSNLESFGGQLRAFGETESDQLANIARTIASVVDKYRDII